MYQQDVSATARGPNQEESAVKEQVQQAAGAAKEGAREVAGTVKEQGREVTREARDQARSVVSDLRGSVTGQARTQNQRLADGLRQASDQFGQMATDDGSPAGRIVTQLGQSGRRAADYLEDRGPEGMLDDVQEFARRKPGTFLLIAAAAGFAIGRLGRAAMAASKDEKSSTPDAYREGDGLYRSRTAAEAYPADDFATGTPTAAPVLDAVPPAPAYPPAATPAYPPAATPAVDPGAGR
jgi:hypothetical protein